MPGTQDQPIPELPDQNGTQDPNSTVALDLSGLRAKLAHTPVPSKLGVRNIGDQVGTWVRHALDLCANHEPFRYDVSLVAVPNVQPNGSIGVATAYAFTLYLSSAILNHPPYGLARIMTDDPTQEQIMVTVRTAVEELRARRSADLQSR